MIKNFFKYIWLFAIVFTCVACSIEEIDKVSSDGTVKFVVKPSNFMSSYVSNGSTKAASDIFEDRIYNAHFLLFDSAGNLMYSRSFEDVTDNTIPTQELDLDFLTGKVTACFIANVPTSTVNGFSKLSEVNAAVLDLNYFSDRVLDTENKQSFFAIPQFDLKGDGNAVKCLPMLGMTECNLDNSRTFEISLKRLFAKVSMNVSVEGDFSISSLAKSFDIVGIHLINLPTKVKLSEPTTESAWVKDASAFASTQIEGPIADDNIYTSIANSVIEQSSYEFYFYVPEYYLYSTDDKSGNYGNQKYKPNMYDKDKYPVMVRMFGKYKGSATAAAQGVTYDLYLGENASANFTLKRNKHYKNFITIKGITNSINGSGTTLDCRVLVEELDEVEILGQTANCYIIGKSGHYRFRAYKGVYYNSWDLPESTINNLYKCTKGSELKELYNSSSNIKIENKTFNKESCEISFDITLTNSVLSNNSGNVILGLVYTEGGKEIIEWSWHLWVVGGMSIGNLNFFEMDVQAYSSNTNVMDRNLGATPSTLGSVLPGTATGLYYKYGCKDPFIDGKGYVGGGTPTREATWKYTNANLSNQKTQTDPCPPGYKLPSSDIWNFVTYENTTRATTSSSIKINDNIYYPNAGHLDGNGDKVTQATYNEKYNGYYATAIGATAVDGFTTKQYQVRYTYYTININRDEYGAAHGKDYLFTYEAMDQGLLPDITITEAEYRERSYRLIGGWGSWSSWKKWSSFSGNSIAKATVSAAVGSEINSNDSNLKKQTMKITNNTTAVAGNGYQVRCMKE